MDWILLIRLLLNFMERNQMTAVFAMSMCIVAFSLYVVLRAVRK
jgi:hypothetical protein